MYRLGSLRYGFLPDRLEACATGGGVRRLIVHLIQHLADTLARIRLTDLLNRHGWTANGEPQHLGATHTKPGRTLNLTPMGQ